MPRLTYEFDALNRLVIRDPAEALEPVKIIEGRLTVDRVNRLHYRARERGAESRDVLLDGTWTLTPAHALGLALHPSEARDGQTVFLRGSITSATDHALIVSLDQRTRGGRRLSQRLELSGRWQADARNRLTFLVARSDGREDRLVFQGAWDIDRAHQVTYRMEAPRSGASGSSRANRRSATRTLTFTGGWDLRPGLRLAYQLGADSRSAFEFQAALQSPTLQARDGRISYQVGIRLSGGRTIRRTVALFGAWKLHRDLSVSFEYAQPFGRRRVLTFEGSAAISPHAQVRVQLRSREGEPVGLAVIFSRSFLREQAQWVMRLERTGEETRLLGGVQIRF